jgi:hypothetical protein
MKKITKKSNISSPFTARISAVLASFIVVATCFFSLQGTAEASDGHLDFAPSSSSSSAGFFITSNSNLNTSYASYSSFYMTSLKNAEDDLPMSYHTGQYPLTPVPSSSVFIFPATNPSGIITNQVAEGYVEDKTDVMLAVGITSNSSSSITGTAVCVGKSYWDCILDYYLEPHSPLQISIATFVFNHTTQRWVLYSSGSVYSDSVVSSNFPNGSSLQSAVPNSSSSYNLTFTGSYENNDDYTHLLIDLNGSIKVCSSSLQFGSYSWSCSVPVVSNASYSYNVILSYSSAPSSSSLVSPDYSFTIGEYAFADEFDPFTDTLDSPECSLARLDVCLVNVFKYLFYLPPDMSFSAEFSSFKDDIFSKFPFNYIDFVSSVWSDLESGSSSSVGSLSVDIGTSSFVLFDSTSLSSNPVASLIRGFLTTLLYLFGLFAIYKRVVSLFDNKSHI